MLPRLARGFGIVLMASALPAYLGVCRWLSTRIQTPLDIPVSLARGHIRTPEFPINFDSDYIVTILQGEVPGINHSPPEVQTRWMLSENEHRQLSGSGSGVWVGAFRAWSGRHRLNIEVESDTAELDAGHPRLRVQTAPDGSWVIHEAYSWTAWGGMVMFLLGAAIWWLSNLRTLREEWNGLAISTSPGPGQMSEALRRRTALRAVSRTLSPTLSPAVLLFVNILIILVMVELIEYSGRPYSKGIPVMTSPWGLRPVLYDGSGSSLVVRIDKQRRWFLDGKRVTPEEFPLTLKDALVRRPDWVVYVDGDGDLQLADVMPAIDSIQGLHAKIVLVTPRER
jgi:hypothetical protein